MRRPPVKIVAVVVVAVIALAAIGVGLIVCALRNDRDIHGRLHVIGVHGNRPVHRVLGLTGVLPVLCVHDGLDALLDQLDQLDRS